MKKSTAEAASTLRLSNGEGKLSIWSSHAREVPESGLLLSLLPADASRGFTRTFQNAEGTEVAVADRRGRVYVLSLLRNRHALVRRPGTPVTAISLLPSHGAAKDLIVGLRTCCLEIWCVETATLRATLANCHAAPPGRALEGILSVGAVSSGTFYSAGRDRIVLWDSATLKIRRTLQGRAIGDARAGVPRQYVEVVQAVCHGEKGDLLVIAFADGDIFAWGDDLQLRHRIRPADLLFEPSSSDVAALAGSGFDPTKPPLIGCIGLSQREEMLFVSLTGRATPQIVMFDLINGTSSQIALPAAASARAPIALRSGGAPRLTFASPAGDALAFIDAEKQRACFFPLAQSDAVAAEQIHLCARARGANATSVKISTSGTLRHALITLSNGSIQLIDLRIACTPPEDEQAEEFEMFGATTAARAFAGTTTNGRHTDTFWLANDDEKEEEEGGGQAGASASVQAGAASRRHRNRGGAKPNANAASRCELFDQLFRKQRRKRTLRAASVAAATALAAASPSASPEGAKRAAGSFIQQSGLIADGVDGGDAAVHGGTWKEQTAAAMWNEAGWGSRTAKCVPLHELTAISSHELAVNRKRLQTLYEHHHEFPAKYRLLIWRFLLRLPENTENYHTLLQRGMHPSVKDLKGKCPLRSQRLLRRLERLLSCLAHWSPLFAEVSFAPAFVFPFAKAFGNDEISAFETIITFIMNWCSSWFETFPAPPVAMLSRIERILHFHDPKLLRMFVQRGVTVTQYAWVCLQTLFTEVLAQDDWLKLFDMLFVYSHDPMLLPLVAVAHVIQRRGALMMTRDAAELRLCFTQQAASLHIDSLLRLVRRLRATTPADIFAGGVMTGDSAGKDSHLRRPLQPLPPGQYPLFANFPEMAINFQKEEREKLRAAEQTAAYKQRVLEEEELRARAVKQWHDQWRDEQQRLLEAQTETKSAAEEEMRALVRKDAKIDERIRALQIRRLRQEQQIHDEVATLTGEKRIAAKAEAQRLISQRMLDVERRLQSREETERLLALDIASSAETLRARLVSEEEVSLATLRSAAERRLQVCICVSTAAVFSCCVSPWEDVSHSSTPSLSLSLSLSHSLSHSHSLSLSLSPSARGGTRTAAHCQVER